MTPERFEEVARLVGQIARDDPSGDDLVTLCLAAMYLLPENVRIRELRETHVTKQAVSAPPPRRL